MNNETMITEHDLRVLGFSDIQINKISTCGLLDMPLEKIISEYGLSENNDMISDVPILPLLRCSVSCMSAQITKYNVFGKVDTIYCINGIIYRYLYDKFGNLEAIIDTMGDDDVIEENVSVAILLENVVIAKGDTFNQIAVYVDSEGNYVILDMHPDATDGAHYTISEDTYNDDKINQMAYKLWDNNYRSITESQAEEDHCTDNLILSPAVLSRTTPFYVLSDMMIKRGYGDRTTLGDIKADEEAVPYEFSMYGILTGIAYSTFVLTDHINIDAEKKYMTGIIMKDEHDTFMQVVYDEHNRMLEMQSPVLSVRIVNTYQDSTNKLINQIYIDKEGVVRSDIDVKYRNGEVIALSLTNHNEEEHEEHELTMGDELPPSL